MDLNIADGSVAKGFDVLVGADGIWSAVRAQLWNEPSARPGTCTYSGKLFLVCLSTFIPLLTTTVSKLFAGYTLFAAEMVMGPDNEFFKSEGYFDAGYKVYIGPGKYFVTSDVGSGRIQWYAFLALPPDTKSRSSNSDFLKEQFEGWTEEIHACLRNTPDDIIEQRDLYDRRPSVLKSWSKGHVTMLGDAVHPVRTSCSYWPATQSLTDCLTDLQMMPNLGQGGCQAIEDAYVLTEQLCDVTDKSQIPEALQRCANYFKRAVPPSSLSFPLTYPNPTLLSPAAVTTDSASCGPRWCRACPASAATSSSAPSAPPSTWESS